MSAPSDEDAPPPRSPRGLRGAQRQPAGSLAPGGRRVGRPPLRPEQKRGKPVAVSLSPNERAELAEIAAGKGMLPSAVLRAAVFAPAKVGISDLEAAGGRILAALTRTPPRLTNLGSTRFNREIDQWKADLEEPIFSLLKLLGEAAGRRKGRP